MFSILTNKLDIQNVYILHILFLVSSEGRVTYSAVKAFLKQHPNGINLYRSMSTSLNTTIDLSEDHLIFGRTNVNDNFYPV